MSLADILILILLFIFALSGLRRGIVWELLTAIGLLAGSVLIYYYRGEILDLVLRVTSPGWGRQWIGALIFLAFFMVIYIGFTVLGQHAHSALDKTPLKWADRILGLAGGVLKGAVLIGLCVVAIEWFDGAGQVRRFLWDSELIRWGKRAVYDVTHWESKSKRRWVLEARDASGVILYYYRVTDGGASHA